MQTKSDSPDKCDNILYNAKPTANMIKHCESTGIYETPPQMQSLKIVQLRQPIVKLLMVKVMQSKYSLVSRLQCPLTIKITP